MKEKGGPSILQSSQPLIMICTCLLLFMYNMDYDLRHVPYVKINQMYIM